MAKAQTLLMVKNVTETSVTNCPKKSDEDVKALAVVFCTPLDLSNKGKNEARNLASNEPNHSNQ